MLASMLGLFSQDLALDLGSSRTRLYRRGEGIIADVPTVLAVRTRKSGRREVLAVGDDARAMIGRTPDGIDAVRPVRSGRIIDFDVVDALLQHLAQTTLGRGSWSRPRIGVAVAPDAPEVAQRAWRDACEAFRAREVALVPAPLAAAAGCGLDIEGTSGHMVVDLGAGTTEIAVLCMREVITSATLEVGGDVLDGAIIRHLRRDHALLIGPTTAERVKLEIGAATEPDPYQTIHVSGRCLRRGVPRSEELSSYEICQAMREPVAALGAGIRRVLEQTPPEIASDVVDHGVLITGGGSLLRNLDIALRSSTGLAILPADAPAEAVVRGTASCMTERTRRELVPA
jgi:rod shape-determining protein MreB